jgi:hypothetical protein
MAKAAKQTSTSKNRQAAETLADYEGFARHALTASVVRVGDGRGFVVQAKHEKLVITAGHCLPFIPPSTNLHDLEEKTYMKLLGPIGEEPTIWAECLFVDVISDIAVLGPPDEQDLNEEYDAYQDFVEPLATFSAADVAPTRPALKMPEGELGWVLSLGGEWQQCRMNCVETPWWGAGPLWLNGAKIEGGMSGSPILSAGGDAVGVVASGGEVDGIQTGPQGPQPRLMSDLPSWLIRALRLGADLERGQSR